MKEKFTLLFSVLFLLALTVQAQTFVKHDASGANNGTSWADAYTDLEDALSNSAEGDQIWVAAGTYKPGGSAPTVESFFTFPHDLELYGGFDGSESMLSERDWEANETILSGDHNGDDIDDNFTDNKTDNSKHVMWLTDTVTTASTVDGFTFAYGNTEPGTASGNDRRAGGFLCYGAPAIRNCSFTQNYGWFAGGLYPRGAGAAGVVIENCEFFNNNGQFGAAMYLNATTATVTDCLFDNNRSVSLGGAVYNNSAQGTLFSNCLFEDNYTDSRGGGLYNTTSPSTITECEFIDNVSGSSSGGGLQVRHTDDEEPAIEVNVMDCMFTGNSATFGGAVGSYDRRSILKLTDCVFEENSSANVGGAVSNAFGARTDIENCTFNENGSDNGGAVYSQNDSARVNIIGSTFTVNTANFGAAISISGDNEPGSTVPLAVLTLENSFVMFNLANEQAGGINISNANMNIISSLLDNNSTFGDIGGAISLNTSDTIKTDFNIINTTITNNSGNIGAGIANWKPGPDATSNLVMQNTILHNPLGNNYEIEDGDPTFTSNGGNLSADDSMNALLTGTNDLNETDPLFVDFNSEEYQLQDNSPCIDQGIAAGAPATDIEGNPRVGEVDMGAYENQMTSSIGELEVEFGNLNIFPNPVQSNLNFTFESAWRGTVEVRVVNMEGKVLVLENIEKDNQVLTGQYSVDELPIGQYELMVSIGNGRLKNTQAFVK